MTNGGMQAVAAAPMPAAVAPQPVATVLHYQWSNEQRTQLRAYADHQPNAVLRQFVQGIDTAHVGLSPEWYDRVAAYRDAHPGT